MVLLGPSATTDADSAPVQGNVSTTFSKNQGNRVWGLDLVEDFGELLPGPIIRLVSQNANKDDFWLNSCIISRFFQKEKLLSLTCTRKCQHHVFKNQGNRVWGLDLVEDF